MFFLTDENGLFNGPSQYNIKGHGDVAVAPGDVPAGKVAQWNSGVPRNDQTYGDEDTGAWSMVEDHRKDTMWLAHGQQYTLGDDHSGHAYDGLGPVPAWLFVDEPPAPEPTLEGAQAAQLTQINIAFDAAAAALTAGYPEAERLTWPIQQSEALAWGADNTTATPYLDGIAAARGIDPAEMRQLTLAQVQTFQTASQQLVGTRQKLRDQINAAKTVEAVQAIVWVSPT